MKNQRHFFIGLVALLLFAFISFKFVNFCGGLFTTLLTGSKISFDSNVTAVENKEMTTVLAKEGFFIKKVPDNFPKDIPIYPSAKLKLVDIKKDGTVFNMMASEGNIKNLDKIIDYYILELAKNSWKIKNSTSHRGAEGITANFLKSNRQLVLTIQKNNNPRGGVIILINSSVEYR